MILILLLSIPALASGLIALTRRRETAASIHVSANLATLAAGAAVAARVWRTHSAISWNLLRADSLSAFMIAIVAFVGAVAGIYATGYIKAEFGVLNFRRARLFYSLFQLFI